MDRKELIEALEKLAPPAYAMDWDNPGLQVGSPEGGSGCPQQRDRSGCTGGLRHDAHASSAAFPPGEIGAFG